MVRNDPFSLKITDKYEYDSIQNIICKEEQPSEKELFCQKTVFLPTYLPTYLPT